MGGDADCLNFWHWCPAQTVSWLLYYIYIRWYCSEANFASNIASDGSQTRHNERRQIFLSCCTNYGYQRSTRLKWGLKLTFEARISRDLKLECTCFVRKYSAVGLLGLRGCCILDDCLWFLNGDDIFFQEFVWNYEFNCQPLVYLEWVPKSKSLHFLGYLW